MEGGACFLDSVSNVMPRGASRSAQRRTPTESCAMVSFRVLAQGFGFEGVVLRA